MHAFKLCKSVQNQIKCAFFTHVSIETDLYMHTCQCQLVCYIYIHVMQVFYCNRPTVNTDRAMHEKRHGVRGQLRARRCVLPISNAHATCLLDIQPIEILPQVFSACPSDIHTACSVGWFVSLLVRLCEIEVLLAGSGEQYSCEEADQPSQPQRSAIGCWV